MIAGKDIGIMLFSAFLTSNKVLSLTFSHYFYQTLGCWKPNLSQELISHYFTISIPSPPENIRKSEVF